jgi:hypothetical protein
MSTAWTRSGDASNLRPDFDTFLRCVEIVDMLLGEQFIGSVPANPVFHPSSFNLHPFPILFPLLPHHQIPIPPEEFDQVRFAG